jgi:hypothetical protein
MSARSRLIHQSTACIFLLLFIFICIFILILFKSSQYLISSSSTTIHVILNNIKGEQTSTHSLSIYCLHMRYRLDNEQYLPKSPTLRAPSLNSTRLHRLPYRYSQWKSSPLLPRRLTPCEHTLIMRLLIIIERMCRKHEITFMMSDGTLLGSWRHHDIIPWDGDVNLMIPIKQKSRLADAINQLNETLINFYLIREKKTKRQYYKISFKHTSSSREYAWNFPCVDVFFYVRNRTHLWQMEDRSTTTKVRYIFPLVMRPLGELWLPAPSKPHRIFQFDPYDECRGHFWDHRNEDSLDEITYK